MILDVGCTGSPTFALTKFADLAAISTLDYSRVFVEAANRRNTDPHVDSDMQELQMTA